MSTGSSSSGRERVLAQIRQSLGRSGPAATPDTPRPITPLPGRGPVPAFTGDVVERFVAKMVEKAATVERLGGTDEVGAAVLRYLDKLAVPLQVRVSGALRHLAWPAGLQVAYGAAVREDLSSVTPCFAAVAESGGIATLSGADTPSSLNFVPDNHVVVIHAAQVVAHFEDLWAKWRATGRPLPRTVNIISGPSRTADIEQTIQLGAHGPRRLHILLIAA
ncbi:MAG: lactate utilization protein C [Leptothrix sp. (in: Bacteria)]|nr:lactate utilization protein C [Leptothrix sp. (in: b-proteobacteria)]